MLLISSACWMQLVLRRRFSSFKSSCMTDCTKCHGIYVMMCACSWFGNTLSSTTTATTEKRRGVFLYSSRATVDKPGTRTTWVQPSDRLDRRGTWQTIQQRFSSSVFCRSLWAVLARAGVSTLWCCPSSISSADHSVAHPPRCHKGWFWRGYCGVWPARTMQVSVSWQLPEESPVDPQGSWSCFAPSRWFCAQSRRCGEVSSGT